MSVTSVLLFMPPSEGQEGSSYMSFLMLFLIIIVFYMFIIRPQMRKSKEQRKYREQIKKGDKIITIGGIHGKIIEVSDQTFIIEVEGQNRLKIEKSAVAMDSASQLGARK